VANALAYFAAASAAKKNSLQNRRQVIEDLARKGFATKDWFKFKLTHNEVLLALKELAKFHACGLVTISKNFFHSSLMFTIKKLVCVCP
jgi:hypothetical protein